jgi:hypothetical protein
MSGRMSGHDRLTLAIAAVILAVLAIGYANNTDVDAARRCRAMLADARTQADTIAAMVQRPTRIMWRDLAPSCYELGVSR